MPPDSQPTQFYDRSTTPIDLETFQELYGNERYCSIRHTTLDKQGTTYMVITAWEGTDQGSRLEDAPDPLIFVSVSYQLQGALWEEQSRLLSPTESQAQDDHDTLLAQLTASPANC